VETGEKVPVLVAAVSMLAAAEAMSLFPKNCLSAEFRGSKSGVSSGIGGRFSKNGGVVLVESGEAGRAEATQTCCISRVPKAEETGKVVDEYHWFRALVIRYVPRSGPC
jgi:hypothetical protein